MNFRFLIIALISLVNFVRGIITKKKTEKDYNIFKDLNAYFWLFMIILSLLLSIYFK